ncbi:putative transcription factor MYB-HB-like family [Medicago truncatula]|uniref:Myb-like transcription factor family protein n=1 Tax=Medicago truncatula TaxID=3880 RepID=G7JU63_MEDTR|nr:myb family transcription factor EFM [Medicago truncatula]AES91405.1 myb-like transcription factor family protein [Medicago truncatula]RHN63865.1 putative transcription factor MYB-HB-like family [Medicago truncatula]
MASSSELGLDCKPHSYSMLLKSFGEQSDQSYKLEEFVSRLEEERLKIDAFKRELPLCMQLLTNAMEASKQQLQAFRSNQGAKPILEEFIPVKQLTSSETLEKTTNNNVCDMANWMTSAQLWSQTSELGTKQQQNSTKENNDNNNNIGFNISPKHRNGGAFLPFSKERNNSSCQGQGLPELALASTQKEEDKKHVGEAEKGKTNSGNEVDNQGKGSPVASSQTQTTSNNSNQTHRKARRCWSPDLHRRFVNALQMLGGSQVATPKQIRELMKVDGLTNDEVKSHLQKYRLHTRRPSPSAQNGAPAAQLVVLGGIWVPPEYATAAHAGGTPTLYGGHPTSHHLTLPHYCTAPGQDQYYTTAPPPQQLLPPPHHMHHVYKTTPHGQGSPETCGDGLDSIENGKTSESSSWKEGSSEDEGERKGFVEESNGSEITLKF